MASFSEDDPNEFIRPATADTIPNAYFIGPFGRRVSFASQQRRVLNTIWALETEKRIVPGKKIAVIGAGLAGVTAAIGLAARKFSVVLYEQNPKALRKQSQTNHRYIHPTINFWPEEPIRPGTYFPFLDWAAGKCEDVIKEVYEQWEALKDGNRFVRQHLRQVAANVEVTKIEPMLVPDKTVRLHFLKGKSAVYDAVFVTTGFGTEEVLTHTNTKPYWTQDDVEDSVRDSARTNFLVSGTGDGGLIDTLRLIHKKFDLGRFCVKVAQELDLHGVSQDLLDIENASKAVYYERAKAAPLNGNADEIKKAAAFAAGEAALEYHRHIEDLLLSGLPDSVNDLLNSSIINKRKRIIVLVGQSPQPYSIAAAPIHKLLIAHALHEGIISYEQGTLKSSVKGPLTVTHGKITREKRPEYAIARHGSDPPLAHFVTDAVDRARLRRDQENATSWIREGIFPPDHFIFDGNPPHDGKNKIFINTRLKQVKRYFDETFGADTVIDLANRCFLVSGLSKLDRPPSEMFGISIKDRGSRKRYVSPVRVDHR